MDLAATVGYFTTARHEALRSEVREFAEQHVAPAISKTEQTGDVNYDLAHMIARRGWIGVTVGSEFGGMAAGHLAKTIMLEELSSVSAAAGAITQASQLGVAKLLHYGTPEQQQRWLPAIAAGECLPTIAVTEEESGGNVLDMTTSAVRDGDEYVLNGHKTFVGNSHVGDLHGVVLRTGPGSRGLTAFLVESWRDGCSVVPPTQSISLPGFSFGKIVFSDCRVPATNMIGIEGQGLQVAYSSSLLYGRPNLTAVALGIHRALLTRTVEFAKTQHRKGRPLHEIPVVKDKLGRMQSLWMTSRLLAYHAVHLLDSGLPCDAELINAKVTGVESLIESVDLAMSLYGAPGLAQSQQMARVWSDAQAMRPPAGTTDIQHIRLAEVALGIARQPWSVIHQSPLDLGAAS